MLLPPLSPTVPYHPPINHTIPTIPYHPRCEQRAFLSTTDPLYPLECDLLECDPLECDPYSLEDGSSQARMCRQCMHHGYDRQHSEAIHAGKVEKAIVVLHVRQA